MSLRPCSCLHALRSPVRLHPALGSVRAPNVATESSMPDVLPHGKCLAQTCMSGFDSTRGLPVTRLSAGEDQQTGGGVQSGKSSKGNPELVAAHCYSKQRPFQLRGSEADEGCMRESPPVTTTGCYKVLCTVATETSKRH